MSKLWCHGKPRNMGSIQVSSAAVCSTPRIAWSYKPGALTRRYEWEKTIRRVGQPSQRIACAYGYRLVWVWFSCHDGRSSDAGSRLIEQSTAYEISCSSVNQLPPADCGDRDPCLSSTGAALLFPNCQLTLIYPDDSLLSCIQITGKQHSRRCPEPCPPQYDQSARRSPRQRR